VFNSGANASAFTITDEFALTISGVGITNNSGITQNFVATSDSLGIRFSNSATAGTLTRFTNNGSAVSGAFGGVTAFLDSSTADNGTFTNNRGTGDGGSTEFQSSSTAGSATINNNAGTVGGAVGGGTLFLFSSTAGSATLIANGGTGAGGSIRFYDSSDGGTARVEVRNNGTGPAGNLDISTHYAGSVTIGSLEGSGDVFLGGTI